MNNSAMWWYIPHFFTIDLCYTFLILAYVAHGQKSGASRHNLNKCGASLLKNGAIMAVPTVIFCAYTEEILFRAIPLWSAVVMEASPQSIVLICIASAILFGYLHGGKDHIPIQGVSGLLYSLQFIILGGLSENSTVALWATTATHALFNLTIVGTLTITLAQKEGWRQALLVGPKAG